MPWKRRQSTWPYVAALGCLFLLTLAAPLWWQRHRGERGRNSHELAEQTAATPKLDGPSSARSNQPAPALPPLAGSPLNLDPATPQSPPPLAAPSLAGAVVESTDYDYVVVVEPLVEAPATVETPEAPPSAVAQSFAEQGAPPPLDSVPAPTAPPRPNISPETLVRARDAMLSLLSDAQGRLQRAVEQSVRRAAANPTHNPMRVVVQDPSERLAMVPQWAPAVEPQPESALIGPRIAIAPTPEMEHVPELAAKPHLARRPEPPPAPPLMQHRPVALLRDLEALRECPAAAPWANTVLARFDELMAPGPPVGLDVQRLLGELEALVNQGLDDALGVTNPDDRSAWTRVARALDRRLPLWRALLDEQLAAELALHTTPASEAALLRSVHEVAALTAGTEQGAAWRDYFRLDDLAGLTSIGGADYEEARRAAARDVLIRMADPWLTQAQREFLAQPELAALERELHPWASGPVSIDALAALVEDFELTGSLGDAEAIAEIRLRMKWSDHPRLDQLAGDLNRNYRNANVRFAVSADMFNRMIPPQQPVVAPVNDHIAGAHVRGRSRTETQVHVRLLPDANVWRLGLEVDGTVHSQTYSDVGPARMRNASRMVYEARKLIMINRYGLHIWPAEAQADGRNSLTGVESRFDAVPVVGALVEDVVRDRHREGQAAAIAQVKAKVNRQARERMDREGDAKLHDLEARLTEHVLQPLERFSIAAEPVDMSTTAERAVMRLRLANEHHLGAHTPRPSAPSDSLVSLQLHHSALNNAVRGLDLDGRRMTVGELHELMRSKFSRRPEAPPADLPQKAIVEFAAHDAVRIACHDDCVELALSIVELRKGRDSIRNVIVHAFFRPVIDGLEVKLVRDGSLQFEGAHLRSGPRLVLHSVFGKLLRRDQEIPVLVARVSEDQRLDGLMITQLVIDDGWIALSVGPALPERTAWRTRSTTLR